MRLRLLVKSRALLWGLSDSFELIWHVTRKEIVGKSGDISSSSADLKNTDERLSKALQFIQDC